MQQELAGCETRLYKNGLAEPDTAVFGAAEDRIYWNCRNPACPVLEPLFSEVRTQSLLYARPAEPYATVMSYLCHTAIDGAIRPDDCETRTLLQDLPVTAELETRHLAGVLQNRSCAVVPGQGVVACGATPAQAYVNFSAACFAGFIKFFSDTLNTCRSGEISSPRKKALDRACRHLPEPAVFEGGLMRGPFDNETDVHRAIVEAGREIISRGLVNACFGNISYRLDKTLYITTSGSFLDDLEEEVVAADLESRTCSRGKPSSEIPAHMEIATSTAFRAVLHGHPLFSVIMSMDCDERDCPNKGSCHVYCPKPREIRGIPVVTGEVGGGPHGLCHTVPAAIKRNKAAIVHGHGVFTCSARDFNNALGRMVTIEQICRKTYFEQIGSRMKTS
ncbi:MAG: class II aldolase/adducin family protein [Desulfobacteraceae bacterium]|nr:class II aldolase/adducin family protein [Desulfobacteraceae bacterium]